MQPNDVCYVIDDDDDDRYFFEVAMQAVNPSMNCVSFGSSSLALHLLENEHHVVPVCIFIDIRMPRIDGLSLLKEIKKLPWLQTVPVVTLSTSNYPANIIASEQLHAAGYMVKPTSIPKMEAALQEVFGKLSAANAAFFVITN